MISVREMMDDYYTFDEEKYMVIGKASRRTFTLGDRVRVRVLRASLEQKLLDYELLEKLESASPVPVTAKDTPKPASARAKTATPAEQPAARKAPARKSRAEKPPVKAVTRKPATKAAPKAAAKKSAGKSAGKASAKPASKKATAKSSAKKVAAKAAKRATKR
jgi:ribonuclease R